MNDTPATPPPAGGERPSWVPAPQNPYDTTAGASTPPPPGPPEGPPAGPYGAPVAAPYYGAPFGTPAGGSGGSGGSGGPVGPGGPPLGSGDRPKRRRATFAAGVIAASLLVGGGAGIGGAAAWSSFDDDGSTSSTAAAGQRTTSQVVDTPTQAAADGSVEQVASTVLPSVVKINVTGAQESGSGSGIILSSDGEILTNNHVVAVAGDSGSISVSFNDGSTAPATIVGTDPLTDTALIKATDVSGLTPATIGKSSDLQVGESVVAIGSPFGLESTVTSGIVSALNRPVNVGSDAQNNATVYPAIQTDAAINPGNSGGALVDLAGHVVGINASIQTTTESSSAEGGSIGLGFAIPMDEVMPIVAQMEAGQTPTHARLGIEVSDVGATAGGLQDPSQEPQGAEVGEGAQVQKVSDGSTASKAGLAAGDIVTKVDDQIISGSDALVATVRSYRPGDTVTITYTQGGETKTAQLTLDSDAAAANS